MQMRGGTILSPGEPVGRSLGGRSTDGHDGSLGFSQRRDKPRGRGCAAWPWARGCATGLIGTKALSQRRARLSARVTRLSSRDKVTACMGALGEQSGRRARFSLSKLDRRPAFQLNPAAAAQSRDSAGDTQNLLGKRRNRPGAQYRLYILCN